MMMKYIVTYDDPEKNRSSSDKDDGSVEEKLKEICSARIFISETKTTICVFTECDPSHVIKAVGMGLNKEIGKATIALVHNGDGKVWDSGVWQVKWDRDVVVHSKFPL